MTVDSSMRWQAGLRRAVRATTHPVTVAFGLANLYMIALTGPLISPEHDLVYHLIGAASSIFIPIIFYVLGLWGLLALFLLAARRPGRLRVFIWSALLLALPWVLLETIADLLEWDVPEWMSRVLGYSVLFALLAIVLMGKRTLHTFQKVRPGLVYAFSFFALCGIWIFAQLMWCGWQARNLNPAPRLHRGTNVAASSTEPRQRIIWILLDELSYQQVYGQHFAGLALTEFDRLAAESTVFTHTGPTGEFTRYIVPSLLTGTPASGVAVSSSGQILYTHDKVSGVSTGFDQRRTVFQDAIDAGYRTGLAGWYNPYCRILPMVLDRCYWMYHEGVPGKMSPDHTAMKNLSIPLRLIRLGTRHFFNLGSGAPSEEELDLQMHSTDYHELVGAADRMLGDASIGFLMVHMPIPHPYGIYDRKTGQFPKLKHTSYIDNLELANLYLGHVRQLLESKGQWDSSVVVVMGDHSWRTKLIWESSSGWTDEDEAANKGAAFDDRPAYIVKMPGQHEGAKVEERFEMIRTRALMDAMLRGQVKTAAELKVWVEQQK